MELINNGTIFDFCKFWKLPLIDIEFVNVFNNWLHSDIYRKVQGTSGKGIDYFKDYGQIYSTFRQLYNINLSEFENMQWHEFLFLLEGAMHSENPITKILGYRNFKAPKIDKHNQDYVKNMINNRARYQ